MTWDSGELLETLRNDGGGGLWQEKEIGGNGKFRLDLSLFTLLDHVKEHLRATAVSHNDISTNCCNSWCVWTEPQGGFQVVQSDPSSYLNPPACCYKDHIRPTAITISKLYKRPAMRVLQHVFGNANFTAWTLSYMHVTKGMLIKVIMTNCFWHYLDIKMWLWKETQGASLWDLL